MLKEGVSEDIVFIREVFNDLEQLKLAAKKWRLNFRQLDAGTLEGEMMILDTGQVQLGTITVNRQFEQRGITPEGYRTFAIPADSKQYLNRNSSQPALYKHGLV